MATAVANGIDRAASRRRALNKVALAQAPSAALPAVQRSPLIGGPMDIFSASIRCCQKGGYTC